MSRRLGQVLLLVVAALGVVVFGPTSVPAFAECGVSPLATLPVPSETPSESALPTPSASPTPIRSAHSFEGSVVALTNGGLNATVIRSDGVVVSVHGGSGRNGAIGADDRVFVVGAVYQFEPLNDASPYSDSLCTATKVIWSPTTAPLPDTQPAQPWLGFSAFDFAMVGILALGLGGAIGARIGFGRGRKAGAVDDEFDDDDDVDTADALVGR